MAAALSSIASSPLYTKAAILLALKSDAGLNTAWIVVEAEDDYNVYHRFMNPVTTVVKTSESDDGRRGCANVELIVTEVKTAVPKAHICGIRDADYTKYEDSPHVFPDNIYPTDRRDLEMMMLESAAVQNALRKWATLYDTTLAKVIPICKHLGYLRIYNNVMKQKCMFRDLLKAQLFWDFNTQSLKLQWKTNLNTAFGGQVGCNKPSLDDFIKNKSLKSENFYDICRGHDLLYLLSLALVNVSLYSPANIMLKMIEAYSLVEFQKTRLYAKIQSWQTIEGVKALI